MQINSGVGAPSSDLNEARNAARRLLDENPNLGCSRLLCPRRLAPETHYTGFLVPAFEKGRLAGLGASDGEIAEVPNARPAWPAAGQLQGALRFPVYQEWGFSTSGAGDFEALARLLVPVDSSSLEADQLIDIQEPGWGVRYRSERPDREHITGAKESARGCHAVDGRRAADGAQMRAFRSDRHHAMNGADCQVDDPQVAVLIAADERDGHQERPRSTAVWPVANDKFARERFGLAW